MYKYNNVVLRAGRSWLDENRVKQPTNWMSWTDEEKAAKGLVWEDDPLPFDNRYYWGWDAEGNLIPKELEDVNAVDENGDPILDEDGNQVVTKGLKSQAIAKAKEQAGSELSASDWMVIKAAEVSGYTVPAEVTANRAAIRQQSNDKEAAILACTTLEEFIALENPVSDEA